MARFRFALEPLLSLRLREEEQARSELALRLRELRDLEQYGARLRDGLRRYLHAPALLQLCDAALSAHVIVAGDCRAAVQDAREDCLAVSNARKAIERLRDQRLEEHRASARRAEERELDESR